MKQAIIGPLGMEIPPAITPVTSSNTSKASPIKKTTSTVSFTPAVLPTLANPWKNVASTVTQSWESLIGTEDSLTSSVMNRVVGEEEGSVVKSGLLAADGNTTGLPTDLPLDKISH